MIATFLAAVQAPSLAASTRKQFIGTAAVGLPVAGNERLARWAR